MTVIVRQIDGLTRTLPSEQDYQVWACGNPTHEILARISDAGADAEAPAPDDDDDEDDDDDDDDDTDEIDRIPQL